MPRYAILHHDHPVIHWDLLLEHEDTLRSWRLVTLPTSGEVVQAEWIPDHRLLYLDYEGPVSQNRGTVSRWDRGVFEWIRDETDEIEIHVDGEKLSGTMTLTTEGQDNRWSVAYRDDS
ncbi:MAG: DNA polymerase ligase N-terminal domain-containing protein [Planctomycetaceae bacterium]